MPQIVPAEVLEPELGDYLVPVGGVAENSCGDAPAARAGEQARVGVAVGHRESALDQLAYLNDQRNISRALALGGLVDEATWTWCRLPADVPDPVAGVDVSYAVAGHLSDPGPGCTGEQDDVAPDAVLSCGACHECVGQLYERGPVRQGERARIIELVLGELELVLPAIDPRWVSVDQASRTACSMTLTRMARLFLTVDLPQPSSIQPTIARSTAP